MFVLGKPKPAALHCMIMLFSLVPSLTETLCTCNPPAPPHSTRRFQHCPTFLHDVAINPVLLGCERRPGSWRCVRAFCLGSTRSSACAAALYTSARLSLFSSARAGHHVRPCIRGAAPLAQAKTCSLAKQPQSGKWPSEQGGRGVSVQAAGYLTVLGLLLLRPFPLALPSSQRQREVSRGRAGPSLCHYPSITCHPPTLC